MANNQKSILLGLVIVIAASLGVVLTLFGEGQDPQQAATNTGMQPTVTESPRPSSVATNERSAAVGRGPAELEVTVVDPEQRDLFQALVTIEYAGEFSEDEIIAAQPRPKLTPGSWRDLHAGLWNVTVTCPRYSAATLQLNLPPGKKTRHTVTLMPMGRIHGTVMTAAGRPVPYIVYLMRPDQSHPQTKEEGEQLIWIRADKDGKWEHLVEEESSFHVSVGGPGNLQAGDPFPRTVSPGEELECRIILGTKAVVRIEVEDVPSLEEDRSNVLMATIQIDTALAGEDWNRSGPKASKLESLGYAGDLQGTRSRDGSSPAAGGKGGGKGGGGQGGNRNAESEGALTPNQVVTVQPDGAVWQTVTARMVPQHGVIEIDTLDAGSPFRLLLEYQKEKFVSDRHFSLEAGVITQLRMRVPTLVGSTGPGGGLPTFPLIVNTDRGSDDMRPGIHWN